jgi:hypothetical protein
MPWRTRATTHGRYRLGSATRTSNTPSGTPSWPQIGLRTSGDENLPLSVVERQRLKEISDENRFYCEKWGMKADTHEHILCTLDLQEIRARLQERIASDIGW